MGFMERLAERAAESRLHDVVETVRIGWNNYSFVFYITGVSAILAALFGIAGWISIAVTLVFFYYVGKFRRHFDREKSKRPWKY
ncbi:MAG: hypothetical protein KGH57_01520 [Candidatus Micrarchaeota archaeon]|nr:hypothetical protein [Candidatus Micrarchaeota archaeon]